MVTTEAENTNSVKEKSCCPTNNTESKSTNSCCGAEKSDLSSEKVSAVEFSHERRIHISINVRDVKKSYEFYKVLFNINPTTYKSDYAKFEPVMPPINFTINEHNEEIVDNDGHFGIELKSIDAVQKTIQRLTEAGLSIDARETQVACCHSVQDKAWLIDPDGNHWEFFVVTESDVEEGCGLTCICYDPETEGCNWKKRA